MVLDQGLVFPAGIAIAHDGTLYLTNFGIFPGGGEVLKVSVHDGRGSVGRRPGRRPTPARRGQVAFRLRWRRICAA